MPTYPGDDAFNSIDKGSGLHPWTCYVYIFHFQNNQLMSDLWDEVCSPSFQTVRLKSLGVEQTRAASLPVASFM
jgi:hypothetical protein